jgi:hypothetical protein
MSQIRADMLDEELPSIAYEIAAMSDDKPIEITPEMRKAGSRLLASWIDGGSTAIGGYDWSWRYEDEAEELFLAMLKARACPVSDSD